MSYLYDMYGYGSPFGHGSREYNTQQMQQLPTYNLWTGSTFHNRSELIPRHLLTASQNDNHEPQPSFAPEVKPKREIVRDAFNRRIITKESLYKEPEFFFEPENEPESPINGPPNTERSEPQPQITPSDEWTDLYWRRAGVTRSLESKDNGSMRPSRDRDSRFKKKIMDSLAQPLKSSKGESMMQKMGWQGGALGKEGVGIVEPIAPNIDYAQTTIGFGLRTELQAPKKKVKAKKCYQRDSSMDFFKKTHAQRKEDFVTNALLYIREFVLNDWETEVIFDMNCTSKERRVLHQCVNEIINESCDELFAGESNMVKITNETQQRALQDIRQYNCYVLYTESHGVMPIRQLCLYKDAPEHVYLVTPDDFKDEEGEGEGGGEGKGGRRAEGEDDNPFLKSIKRSLDDEIDEPGDLGKLIKYFLEFVRDDTYSEFRFLGPFDNELAECLSDFLSDVAAAITDDGNRVRWRKLFNDESLKFELIENCNGTMVIHKRKKDAET